MSKSNVFENDFLLHLFNNADIALIGDATGLRGSSTAGNLYLSLHTADPGEGGDQGTSEVTYTGYARKAIARTSGGFTISGNAVQLTADADFVAGTGGSGVATHFGIGCSSSGSGKLLYSGTVTPNITTGNGVTPRLSAGQNIVTED